MPAQPPGDDSLLVCRIAQAAICARFFTPSRRSMWPMWFPTVPRLTTIRAAIWPLVSPCAINCGDLELTAREWAGLRQLRPIHDARSLDHSRPDRFAAVPDLTTWCRDLGDGDGRPIHGNQSQPPAALSRTP